MSERNWYKLVIALSFLIISMCGCRIYSYKSGEVWIGTIGESEVSSLSYRSEPNYVNLQFKGYRAGEKVAPSAQGLIFGNK